MATVASNVLQLRWDTNSDGIITVTPEDQDRFSLRVGQAIKILQQQASSKNRFITQFHILHRTLAEWLRDREDVARAVLTQRDGALAFVVVRKSCEYDEVFEDALSELDYGVANDSDLDLLKMDVIGLPNASESAISSFIDPDFTLEYTDGTRTGSHSPGQQE